MLCGLIVTTHMNGSINPLASIGQGVASRSSPFAVSVPESHRLATNIFFSLAGTELMIHLLLAGRYGYFRDELYFLDCARHLGWGYVDHAPLIALYSRMALLLGGSLFAVRLLPAIAGALLVALTILIAWRLGADRYGQALAGLSVLAAPGYLAGYSLLTMNAFEPLYWMGCTYLLIRIIQTGNSRLWTWFGVLAGLGLMNKHSTAFFGLAVVIGLLLTRQREEFAKPWIWIGGLVALLIFSPNLIWQVQHHFPTLEDLHNVQVTGKNVVLSPPAFMRQQILMMHPILFPIWLSGLWFFLAGGGRQYRVLGWVYLALLIMFMALDGKDYYLAPAYPMLFAGGAVAVEDWLNRGRGSSGKLWPKITIASVIVVAGAVLAPLALPLLPPDNYIAYEHTLHIVPPKSEVHHEGPLPQIWGDQFGWPELVAEVAQIYNSLPPDERAKTGILTGNYGEAGAIDLFGPKYGLPIAMSGHQTHYYWGTHGFEGENLITIQYGPRYLGEICNSVEQVGEHYNRWGMAEENHAIYFCRGLKQPLSKIWEDQKHWD
jgi:Dolichyl-phosphate-mannose-protein mannosyltransferase